MGHNTNIGEGMGKLAKSLLVALFKCIGILVAFAARLAGITLIKLSELLEKICGKHGTGH